MYSTSNHPIIAPPPTPVRDVTDSNVDTFFATISSLDRNVVKYPHANSFTVDLPQEYNNVTSMSLQQSFFPNVSVDFTLDKNNVDLVFRFTDIPAAHNSHIEIMIYVAIKQSIDNNNYYRIRISDGTYTQEQLLLEVQNRMNQVMSDAILKYYENNTPQLTYQWGDYVYANTGVYTTDGHLIVIHPLYSSHAQAVDACNSIAGSVVPLNLAEINAFARRYGTALTPPPLLAIPTVAIATTAAVGATTYTTMNNNAITNPGTYYGYMSGLFAAQGGYTYFKLFYDKIQKKSVFGNSISAFDVVLDFAKYYATDALDAAGVRSRHNGAAACGPACDSKMVHTNYVNWGLPIYMGFSGKETLVAYPSTDPLPAFYYYDKVTEPLLYNPFRHATTAGFVNSSIYILAPCNQLNLEVDIYYYMELDGFNMIDELLPYKNNAYTLTNGSTTGLINSLFAKRKIMPDRSDQFQDGRGEEKTFTPALRRMNRVSVRIRYHDGREPNFGSMPINFTLKLVCQKNQIGRSNNPGFAAPA